MKWYIVQAHAGAEKKVSEQIKEELAKVDQESKFGEALVPTQDVTEIKKGKAWNKPRHKGIDRTNLLSP